MYCSNCGAPLPENGICTNCGVPAQNMTFTGHFQGNPVAPQQQFNNPNPMYVQYQGSNQGIGQPYMQQENAAIRGIKDPKLVANIGAIIKDCSGSMMMVMVALLTTIAMIFSYIELIYSAQNAAYILHDTVEIVNVAWVFVKCIPFTIFAVGAWLIVFHGYGAYERKLYNDRACMNTAGFSTVQAGGIVMLVPTIIFAVFMAFMLVMMLFAGAISTFDETDSIAKRDIMYTALLAIIVILGLVVMIIMAAALISQMSKIKHAIRGRNYESISLLLPVLLFIMAGLQLISLMYSAFTADLFATLITGIYALWYAMVACCLLYFRSRIKDYIMCALGR